MGPGRRCIGCSPTVALLERATGVLRGVRGTPRAARARGLMPTLNLGGHVQRRPCDAVQRATAAALACRPRRGKACRSWCRTRCTATRIVEAAIDRRRPTSKTLARLRARRRRRPACGRARTWPRSFASPTACRWWLASPDGALRRRPRRLARRRGPHRRDQAVRALLAAARRAGRGQGMRAVRGPAARRGGCLQRVRPPMHPRRMLRLTGADVRARFADRLSRGRRRADAGGTWTCRARSSSCDRRARPASPPQRVLRRRRLHGLRRDRATGAPTAQVGRRLRPPRRHRRAAGNEDRVPMGIEERYASAAPSRWPPTAREAGRDPAEVAPRRRLQDRRPGRACAGAAGRRRPRLRREPPRRHQGEGRRVSPRPRWHFIGNVQSAAHPRHRAVRLACPFAVPGAPRGQDRRGGPAPGQGAGRAARR